MKNKIALVTLILAILIGVYFLLPVKQLPFDPSVWMRSDQCKPIEEASKRYFMSKDLVDKHLPGKNRVEIEALLGPSLNENVLPGKKRDLLYCIGHSSSLGVSMNWLAIHLDENGKFRNIEILSGD